MPWRSRRQMRFMYARHPEIAARWTARYGVPENLPERVSRATHAIKNAARAKRMKRAREQRKG